MRARFKAPLNKSARRKRQHVDMEPTLNIMILNNIYMIRIPGSEFIYETSEILCMYV